MANKRQVGRNEPCPCGSGKKFKKCHGAFSGMKASPLSDPEIKRKIREMNAAQLQRQKQQGLGRPIISCEFKGYRFVAVGSQFRYSKKWKTFHDFLVDYLKSVFEPGWGNRELKKQFIERHPILQWYDYLCKEKKKSIKQDGQVSTAMMTGAVFAYLSLSYNLYLLAHNMKVHSYLVKRLANRDLFYPAFYETMVAALFIKAGFTLEPEDEDDSTSDHAEFLATSQKTGKNYSVEAKHRAAGKKHTAIRNQLYNALKKDLPHKRVVFIDLNIPENNKDAGRVKWLKHVIKQMRDGEQTITINGKPAPKAYVFITNHPFLYNLDSFRFSPAAVAEGFKIPDFKIDTGFHNLREALDSREKHIDMLDLMKAMKEYGEIPCTWDGEIPEYAFGEIAEPILKIGEKYLIPDDQGNDVVAELLDCSVSEEEKKVYCIQKLANGKTTIGSYELSEIELQAYRKYPDTFFGVYKKQDNRVKGPFEKYDFFYGVYKNTAKEKLLELLKDHRDISKFKEMTQEELAKVYCEILVYSVTRQSKPSQTV